MASKKNKARSARDLNPRKFKKKTSVLVIEKVEYIDYKDVDLLQRFMSDRAKIRNRRVAGKTFYRNGDRWLDAEIRKLKDAKPIRVEFGSTAYFDLLREDPAVAKWLALGNHVSFVLRGKLYEVHDAG